MFAYCGNNAVIRADTQGNFWYVIVGVAALVGIIITVSGCSNQTNPYGAAKPYAYVKGGANTPNCYAFAIGLKSALNPGMLAKTSPSFNNVKAVAKAVIEDLRKLGRSGRILDNINSEIYSNEYRIAVRCGTRKYKFVNGKFIYNSKGSYDYHFMYQTSSGAWAEKHGIGGNSIIHYVRENPDTLSWDLDNLKGYYDSDIVYIAVTW